MAPQWLLRPVFLRQKLTPPHGVEYPWLLRPRLPNKGLFERAPDRPYGSCIAEVSAPGRTVRFGDALPSQCSSQSWLLRRKVRPGTPICCPFCIFPACFALALDGIELRVSMAGRDRGISRGTYTRVCCPHFGSKLVYRRSICQKTLRKMCSYAEHFRISVVVGHGHIWCTSMICSLYADIGTTCFLRNKS